MAGTDGPTWHDGPQPSLQTERLVLRPFAPTDAPRVQELAGDRALADTTQLPHPYPPGAAERWIATHQAKWSAGELISYAITLRSSGELIGSVSLVIHEAHDSAELGYWLGRDYWNNGYTTEAATALVGFGFETVGLHRIEAPYLTRNAASGRVMEKLGMTLEGVARQSFKKWGVREDIATRAILRPEWERLRDSARHHCLMVCGLIRLGASAPRLMAGVDLETDARATEPHRYWLAVSISTTPVRPDTTPVRLPRT
jgi:[ribosomal protein S5]-alanine N-acetyltransferase